MHLFEMAKEADGLRNVASAPIDIARDLMLASYVSSAEGYCRRRAVEIGLRNRHGAAPFGNEREQAHSQPPTLWACPLLTMGRVYAL